MKIEIATQLTLGNIGINKLIKLAEKKGNVAFDFRKGKITFVDFPIAKLDDLLNIVNEFFEISNLEISNSTKFKIRNDEKELTIKKQQIKEEIKKKPTTILSQVRAYVFKEKVFTLTQLRQTFPNTNFATLRSYVNDLKQEHLIVELEKGKYSIR